MYFKNLFCAETIIHSNHSRHISLLRWTHSHFSFPPIDRQWVNR